MIPLQASKKSNEKAVFDNLRDDRQKQRPKIKLGDLVGTADIKKYSQKEIVQIIVTCFIQKLKLYTILYHHIDSTIYLRDILKIYYYLLN